MNSVRVSRKPGLAIFVFVLCGAFIVFGSAMMLAGFAGNEVIIGLIGLIMFILFTSILYQFISLSPAIVADQQGIRLGRKVTITWDNLAEYTQEEYSFFTTDEKALQMLYAVFAVGMITATIAAAIIGEGGGGDSSGLHPSSGKPTGTRLTTKDGKSYIIANSSYGDLWQLKTFIDKHKSGMSKAEPAYEIEDVSKKTSTNRTVIFKGKQLRTFRGWSILLLNTFSVVAFFFFASTTSITWLLLFISSFVFGIAVYFAVSAGLYYFTLTDELLTIKNPNLPWTEKRYRLDEIDKILLDIDDKLTLSPFTWRETTFKAAALSRNGWDNLKIELEKRNVTVSDRRVYLLPF